jgi:hypothetical protein
MKCGEGKTLSSVFQRVNGKRGRSQATREDGGKAWFPNNPGSHDGWSRPTKKESMVRRTAVATTAHSAY